MEESSPPFHPAHRPQEPRRRRLDKAPGLPEAKGHLREQWALARHSEAQEGWGQGALGRAVTQGWWRQRHEFGNLCFHKTPEARGSQTSAPKTPMYRDPYCRDAPSTSETTFPGRSSPQFRPFMGQLLSVTWAILFLAFLWAPGSFGNLLRARDPLCRKFTFSMTLCVVFRTPRSFCTQGKNALYRLGSTHTGED